MKVFEDLGLSKYLLEVIKKLGITTPTKIQEEAIPPVIAGKDVVGESATGSGKTIAFGSGIVENVKPGEGLQALILTPTRELAEQVSGVLKELSKYLRTLSVYGGVSINTQIHGLKKAEVVVATPGRLLDHLERRTINLSKIKILVLDEADRMLDMGFIDDVEKIIKHCPKKRQTLFFSATISQEIKRLARKHMNDPINIAATKMVDPAKLKQVYYNIEKNQKLSLLAHLLQHENSGLVMVFCNTRRTTEFVMKTLRANRIKAISIHGGLTQNKRDKNLHMFNDAKAGVLVCTDVAARGLDIANVSHIYNYEIPNDPKDYVHRIGRTARAGESGKVINVLCQYDHDNFSRILDEYRTFSIENLEKPHLERIEVRMDTPVQRGRGSFHSNGRGSSHSGRGSFHSNGRGSSHSDRGSSQSSGRRSFNRPNQGYRRGRL